MSAAEELKFEEYEAALKANARQIAAAQKKLYTQYRAKLRSAKRIKAKAARVKKANEITAWYNRKKGEIARGKLSLAQDESEVFETLVQSLVKQDI